MPAQLRQPPGPTAINLPMTIKRLATTALLLAAVTAISACGSSQSAADKTTSEHSVVLASHSRQLDGILRADFSTEFIAKIKANNHETK